VKLPVQWWRGAIAVTALAFAAYLGFSIWGDWDSVSGAMRRLSWLTIAIVLGLSLLNYGLRFFRWHLYMRWQGFKVPVLRNAGIYLGGFAFTVSPGKAGEAVRGLYLAREGVPHAASLAMLFVERLADLMVMLVLASLVLVVRPDLSWLIGLTFLATLVLLVLATHPAMSALLRRFGEKNDTRLAQGLMWFAGLLGHVRELLGARRLLLIFVLGLIAWGAEGYGLWLLVSSFDPALTPAFVTGVYGVAILAGAAAIFMPGGLGGTEAAMTALLVASGLGLAAAIAVTLICRLATLWFAVLIGAACLALLEFVDWRARKSAMPVQNGARL